jgi:hypothetical protein
MLFPTAYGQRPPATASPPSWPRPSGGSQGNNLPAVLGPVGPPARPAPSAAEQAVGGQVGAPPGTGGSMPGAPLYPVGHSPGQPGYMQESAWRGGASTGWNDKLITRDRHAYWDTGTQLAGNHYSTPGNPPNPVTDGPARPDLRLTQRTISYQKGSDASANHDDLTRPYTRNAQGMYVGEQGTGWSPVYGGVPGLYQPYGTRGGVPYPIMSPVAQGEPGDGRRNVFSGPPHGLHSLTFPDYSSTLGYYMAQPQMHQPRMDRPANSPQAGQAYSQLVVPQGGQQVTRQQPGTVAAARAKWSAWMPGSTGGWRGSARGGGP